MVHGALKAGLLTAALQLCPFQALSQDLPSDAGGRDLYLEVFVNGESTQLVAAFREDARGALTIDAEELANVGIKPDASAAVANGRIAIERLPQVTVVYDEQHQTIHFEAVSGARQARVVDAGFARRDRPGPSPPGFGAVLNYSLVVSGESRNRPDNWDFQGLSGFFEPRLYGPYGVVNQTFIASTSDAELYDTTRLETNWRYTDSKRLVTYGAGDIVAGGLPWTRPVRLGGIQIARDFSLRSDLVTHPIPALTGSAAVPSTVDVYIDNVRRFTGEVPSGPFEIANLPIVSGAGNARVVVRDAQGQDVVTETSYFASSELLAPGLFDFSAEAGFARRFYGVKSNEYDPRPMGLATIRYGLSNTLTLEGHAEGGEDLLNVGAGAVVGIGTLGIGSLAGAYSQSDRGSGYLVAGQALVELGSVNLFARSQRTFGDYDDIASVTAPDAIDLDRPPEFWSARPPKAIDQIGLSFPDFFEDASFGVTYTRQVASDDFQTELVGVTYSQPVFKDATFFASGFASLRDDVYGVYAGISFALGERVNASVSSSLRQDGGGGFIDIAQSAGQETGDYGWRVRGGYDDALEASASAVYNARAAKLEASIDAYDRDVRATGRMEGAIVVAGGGVHFSRPVHDAFAIVNVGASDVLVSLENRPIGVTRSDGRLLVPGLRSNEANNLSFDPSHLPLDAVIASTRQRVVPSYRSGTVVTFGVDAQARGTIVEFRNADGSHVAVGSTVMLSDGREFSVGYDGIAYVDGLQARNQVQIMQPDGRACQADFPNAATGQDQPSIRNIACQ